MLKIDNNFIPCPVEEGDELFPNGIFEFNITEMPKYIQESDEIIQEEMMINNKKHHFSSINESHLDTVDISRPIILAEIAPGRYNLIDGHHRLEKARRTEKQTIQAYKLKGFSKSTTMSSGCSCVSGLGCRTRVSRITRQMQPIAKRGGRFAALGQ